MINVKLFDALHDLMRLLYKPEYPCCEAAHRIEQHGKLIGGICPIHGESVNSQPQMQVVRDLITEPLPLIGRQYKNYSGVFTVISISEPTDIDMNIMTRVMEPRHAKHPGPNWFNVGIFENPRTGIHHHAKQIEADRLVIYRAQIDFGPLRCMPLTLWQGRFTLMDTITAEWLLSLGFKHRTGVLGIELTNGLYLEWSEKNGIMVGGVHVSGDTQDRITEIMRVIC